MKGVRGTLIHNRTSESETYRLNQLLSAAQLGDRKPTQAFAAHGAIGGEQSNVPEFISTTVHAASSKPSGSVPILMQTEIADKLMELESGSHIAPVTTQPINTPSSTAQSAAQSDIAALRAEIAALTHRLDQKGYPRSFLRQRPWQQMWFPEQYPRQGYMPLSRLPRNEGSQVPIPVQIFGRRPRQELMATGFPGPATSGHHLFVRDRVSNRRFDVGMSVVLDCFVSYPSRCMRRLVIKSDEISPYMACESEAPQDLDLDHSCVPSMALVSTWQITLYNSRCLQTTFNLMQLVNLPTKSV